MSDENSEQSSRGENRPQKAAPYISAKTFNTFLEDQKQHGLPSRVDRSVLTRFSGGVGSQLITALKFLGLIRDDQTTTDRLGRLVEVYGTDDWVSELQDLIKDAYTPIMAADLESLTPAQFHEMFKSNYAGADDVIRKSETFFIAMARAAQIPMSARISKYRAPRGSGGRRKATGANRTKADQVRQQPDGGQQHEKNPPPDPNQRQMSPYDLLIDILDPLAMEEEEQNAVWVLIRYLRKRDAESQEEDE